MISPINLTVFHFQEEINMSRNFSRNMSHCFHLLVSTNHGFDQRAIRVNLYLFFIHFQVNQNFIATFSLFPGYIPVNVIVTCNNFSLEAVGHIAILLTKEPHNFTFYHFYWNTYSIKKILNTCKSSIRLFYKNNILEECTRN